MEWRSLLTAIALGVAVTAVATAATAPDDAIASTATLVNTKLVFSPQRAAIDVLSMDALSYGDFVATFTMLASRQGWAARFDADGHTIWTFIRDLPDEDKGPFAHAPEIQSSAVNANGDTFLCGHMWRQADSQSKRPTADLARVDPEGQLVQEFFLQNSANPNDLYRFAKCFRRGKSVIAIAQEEHLNNILRGEPPGGRSSYWIMSLAPDASIEWQATIAAPDVDFMSDINSMTVAQLNKGFVLATTDNVLSEILLLDAEGKVTHRKLLQGRYLLVDRKGAADTIDLFRATPHSVQLVKLNADLTPHSLVQAQTSHQVVPRHVFESLNGGYFVFGSVIRKPGEDGQSAAFEFNASLTSESSVPLNKGGFFDGGGVSASATGTYALTHTEYFVVARTFAPRDSSPAIPRGMVLDFINVKGK